MNARQIIAEYEPDPNAGPYRTNAENVVCVDRETGQVLWRGALSNFFRSYTYPGDAEEIRQRLASNSPVDLGGGAELQPA